MGAKFTSKSGVGGGVKGGMMDQPRRNNADRDGGKPLPSAQGPLPVSPGPLQNWAQDVRGKNPTPTSKSPHPDTSEDPNPGARCPKAEEVPGREQRVGRPPPARSPAPLSPALPEPDTGRWPRLISNTKPGVGRPLSSQQGQADASRGREAAGREQPRSELRHALQGEQASRLGLHCPRAPVPPAL